MKSAPLPPDEPERLRALQGTGLLDTPPEPEFDEIARIAAAICGTPIALVSLLDRGRQWFKARVGLAAEETPRDVAFCAHAILGRDRFVVPDALADERFAENPLVTADPHVRFYAGVPLVLPEGHALGTLCVIDHTPRRLDAVQSSALEALGRQVVAQIELRRRTAALSLAHAELQRAHDEAVAARDRLDEQLEARREAEAEAGRLATILEATPDFACMCDTVGRVLYLNPAGRRMVGLDEGDATGEGAEPPLNVTRFHPPDSLDRLFREAIPGASRDGTWAGELALVGRGGQPVPVSQVIVAHKDARGDVQYFSSLARDITERKEIERLKDEFVSVVSHELRTPLTSIRGSLGLLEGGVAGELPAQARELVQIARSNTDRLVRLINDILDLEKIEAGKMDLVRERLDLGELAEDSVAELRALADGAGVVLRVEPQGAPPKALADRDRIRQVLVNLLSNAIKFSPAGGVVRITVKHVGASVRVSVRDQGPGIPAHAIPRLFGRFQQLDSSDTRKKSGTGLGLAICKALVDRHGGAIGVETEPGAGSSFWFELPQAEMPPRLASGAKPGGGRVLLVEDDAQLAHVLGEVLGQKGYETVHAGTLAEAESLLAEALPDAILLDLELPDGNGFDSISRLRGRAATQDVPVIVLTGLDRERARFGDPLQLDWIQKPFDEASLLRAIERAARPKREQHPGPPRVLVVDDDDGIRALLVALLERLHVTCFEARDGAEALALAKEARPDLIILDVAMPVVDGFEVVAALRAGSALETPLLVYTGLDLTADDRARLRLGITRYLRKARSTEREFLGAVTDLLKGVLAGG